MLCQGQRGILEWRFPHPGPVHVPRPPVRVHRARLAGLLRGRRDERARRRPPSRARGRLPAWLLGLVPLLLIVAAVGAFAALGGPGLGERRGPPVEELAVERTVLEPGRDRADRAQRRPRRGLDRAGACQRRVRAVHAAPRSRSAAWRRATVRIAQPWVEGEAYEVALLTSTGGRSRTRSPSPSRRPPTDARLLRADGAARALRRRDPGRARDALAAVDPADPAGAGCAASWRSRSGCSAFLAIDATLEGFELAGEGSQAFGGAALVLARRGRSPTCC